ncbi:hypothetical protein BAE44_0023050 [Dichanthelium oligosanthes]|uniref:non-specific serine/threonine protein kinase n=1 Tax=Dichanthelium oligosanthes TaxID=888268 RepID=A0A1E5USU1_9POAL|nr:hypothetical protein BAE44_0023050 [Dichanthelium oligosanthes]
MRVEHAAPHNVAERVPRIVAQEDRAWSMASLSTLDVSYNNFEGPLHAGRLFHNASITWFLHNKDMILQKRKGPQKAKITDTGDVLSVWNFDGKLAFEDITRATENFSDSYLIGSGGYGYKAQLQGGRLVAVKKLHPSEEEMGDDKRFLSEIEVLMKIWHRSIVKLFGVLVLEILMGMKVPHGLASMGKHQELAIEDMLDIRLSLPTIVEKKEIALLVEVAFSCLQTSPQFRPEMKDVYQKVVLHKPHSSFALPSHTLTPEEISEV